MSVTASSLVVVSNRLPFTVSRHPDGGLQRRDAAGGLVTAVAPVLIQTSGLWVGWPGCHSRLLHYHWDQLRLLRLQYCL